MARIREKDRDAVFTALSGGVTPRQGIQHIQVGRKDETAAILDDIRRIREGGASARVVEGTYGSGKTFFLTLAKTVALKQNLLVATADFSPTLRLYSSSGQALALYRELMRRLSSATHPDGGALEELLASVAERDDADGTLESTLRTLPYGYDAVTVLAQWRRAKEPETAKERRDAPLMRDACLRWLAGEVTGAQRKMLGVRSSVDDDGAYDALKLIAALASFAGFGGLFVELDEMVNLYKINNSTSRSRNYEVILRIWNECRQGDARHIGFIFAGTPEAVTDPRRGLFSYDALKTRLMDSKYAGGDGSRTMFGSIIELTPMPPESLLVLLGNIVNVEALGDRSKWLMDDNDMKSYLERCYETLGADYYQTPREIIRDFVTILKRLAADPSLRPSDVIGQSQVKMERRASGFGGSASNGGPAAKPEDGTGISSGSQPAASGGLSDDDDDFGF